MINRIDINPEMLTWAIARAGYNLYEFSVKVPNVQEWIRGTIKPTIRQMESFSKTVHIPFGYLFLDKPPQEKLPIPFFRSNHSNSDRVSINVYDTFQLLLQRQEWLKEYLKKNGYDKLKYVSRFKHSNNVDAIIQDLRTTLDLRVDWAINCRNWKDALEHFEEAINNVGIIAVFNSVVDNNTHRPIDVEECRGFVLVDDYAPFIFINNSDSKSAQIFTIAHELAHIWTGHSAGFDFRKLRPADNPIEKLCDQIAAEFLVPSITFNNIWDSNPNFRYTSRYFRVSEIVIARRALDLRKITTVEFFKFYNEYRRREFNKYKPQGGDFFATTRKRLSPTFASHIEHAVRSGQLLYRDAYKLTSLKGDTFNKYFTRYI